MSDDFTTLNPGSGGDSMDEEGVTFGVAPTTRKRPRVLIGGALAAALAAVQNVLPRLTDYALTVRSVDHSETGTNSAVTATITASTTILAANQTGRVGATIYNSSTSATLYLSWGSTCTTTNYSVQVPPLGYVELPSKYRGIVTGVWSAADGSQAFVTELT